MSKKIPQESVENLEVDLQDVALNTIHRSSDGSDHSKVTDNETAITSKADPVDISGTHTETVLTIDFSAIQGKIITLSADRAYSITGLSNSNPVGILTITHNGFIPTFSGIIELESLLDKSGIYYLKFVRQADGTIIQVNQNGETISKLSAELDSIAILDLFTTPFELKGSPGIGLVDNTLHAYVYINFIGIAYTGNTTLNLMSGSFIIGTNETALSAIKSGWHKFTMISMPQENSILTLTVAGGNPIGGDGEIGIYLKYMTEENIDFSFSIGGESFIFGETTIFIEESSANQRKGGRFVAPFDCSIKSVTLYHNGDLNDTMLFGIYEDVLDVPQARLGISLHTQINQSEGWQTIDLIEPVTVSQGTKVWLCWVANGYLSFRFKLDPSGLRVTGLPTYSLDDPFGASDTGEVLYSLYCTANKL